MILKNDIIVEKSLFNGDIVDYEMQVNELYNLLITITNELNIKSLEKVIIKNNKIFTNEQGLALFNYKNNSSQIEFARKPFVNFNRNQYPELKSEALATIYHEMYHVHDNENLQEITLKSASNIKYNSLTIGMKYWSEFYAYYMTCDIYSSRYTFEQFDKIYCEINYQKSNKYTINDFYYYISKLTAYSVKDTLKNDGFKNHRIYYCTEYQHIVVKLNEILNKYPYGLTIDDLIELGNLYYKLGIVFFIRSSTKSNKFDTCL
jgi:hypothetical protein